MKKLLTIVFIFCFGTSFSQTIVNRAGAANTVNDARWQAQYNMYVPRFNDTTAANLQKGIDSSGAVIWTRNTNWFWGRQTYPSRKWVAFNAPSSTTNLTPTCGYPNGTHIVTWDSLLTFDISGGPFVSCCDGIPRMFANSAITLDSNTSTFQRYDLIVIDTMGVHSIKGTPSINPATPQADSCQQILTYVLINGHSNVPAFVTPTNPLIIYDENFSGEWTIDTTNAVTVDTANTAFPVHLSKDMLVTNPSSFNLIRFKSPTVIDLNTYQALKFYVRKTSTASNIILITFYLDGVQQTFPARVQLPNGFNNVYQSYVIPLSSFLILGSTKVDEINISFATPQTASFYIDWIQLQSGALIINPASGTSGTVTSVAAGNLTNVFNSSVSNTNTTPLISFTKPNVSAYTVYGNPNNTSDTLRPTQVNLGTPMVTGNLSLSNIATICNGCYLGGSGGTNQAIPFTSDTIFVKSPIVLTVAGSNDTLSCPTCSVGGIVSAGNGLTDSSNRVILGGALYKTTTIDVTGFKLLITGDGTLFPAGNLQVNNTGGVAIEGITDNGISIYGHTTAGGIGLEGFAIGGIGVESGANSNGIPSLFVYQTGTGDIADFGTASNGASNVFLIKASGALRANNYGVGTFTGTATHALNVDASGNIIEGVTQTPLFYSQPVNATNSGSNPQNLATITVPANALGTNGVKIYGTAEANFLTGSGTKQLEIICSDGTNNALISRTSTTADNLQYFFNVVRQDATHALVNGYIMSAGTITDLLNPQQVTWDFTQPTTVKMTVVQGIASDMTVRWLTANVFEP